MRGIECMGSDSWDRMRGIECVGLNGIIGIFESCAFEIRKLCMQLWNCGDGPLYWVPMCVQANNRTVFGLCQYTHEVIKVQTSWMCPNETSWPRTPILRPLPTDSPLFPTDRF